VSLASLYFGFICKLVFSVLFLIPAVILLGIRCAKQGLRFLLLPALIGAALALFLSSCCLSLPLRSVQHLAGESKAIRFEVTDVPYSGDYSATYLIRTVTINGEKARHTFLLSWQKRAGTLRIGDVCDANVTVSVPETDIPARATDLISLGAFGEVTVDGTISPQFHRNTPVALAASLSDTICTRFSDWYQEDSAALLSAMLIGNRSFLTRSDRYAFRRAGVSHLLSLSGLHISILVLAFYRIAGLLRLPKNAANAILLIGIPAYMVLTGLTPSVVRAGLMALFLIFASFVRRERDSVTSLFFAAFVIVLASPSTILSVGFWLSVTATLGILVAPRFSKAILPNAPRILRCILIAFSEPIVLTLFATLLTFPIVCLTFGDLSLIFLPSNLIFPPMTTVLMYGGILSLAFPFLRPLFDGYASVFLMAMRRAAATPDILISIDSLPTRILTIVFSGMLAVWICTNPRRRKVFLSVLCLTCLLTVSTVAGSEIKRKVTGYAQYLSVSESDDLLILRDGDSTTVCLTGSHSRLLEKSAVNALTGIDENDIDYLFLPVLNDAVLSAVESLGAQYYIRHLICPEPATEYEAAIASQLDAVLAPLAHEFTYATYAPLSLGNITLSILGRSAQERNRDQANVAFTISMPDVSVLYLTARYSASFYAATLTGVCADVMIYGNFGASKTGAESYPATVNCRTAILPNRKESLKIPAGTVPPEQIRTDGTVFDLKNP